MHPDHPHPAGGRGGGAARVPARHALREDRSLPQAAVRRPVRDDGRGGVPAADGTGDHRGRPARLHAGADPERLVHHPGRGPEHHARADEDVPHPARVRLEGRGERRHHADRPAHGAPVGARRGRGGDPGRASTGSSSSTSGRATWSGTRSCRTSSRRTATFTDDGRTGRPAGPAGATRPVRPGPRHDGDPVPKPTDATAAGAPSVEVSDRQDRSPRRRPDALAALAERTLVAEGADRGRAGPVVRGRGRDGRPPRPVHGRTRADRRPARSRWARTACSATWSSVRPWPRANNPATSAGELPAAGRRTACCTSWATTTRTRPTRAVMWARQERYSGVAIAVSTARLGRAGDRDRADRRWRPVRRGGDVDHPHGADPGLPAAGGGAPRREGPRADRGQPGPVPERDAAAGPARPAGRHHAGHHRSPCGTSTRWARSSPPRR